MRVFPKNDLGIAVLCDTNGIVQSVVRDELGLSPRVQSGTSIVQLADTASLEKAGNFLQSLQKLQAVFDWEISVPIQDGIEALQFTGGPVPGGFLVVAARTRSGLARVNEDLAQINNEQVNSIRSTAKELARRSTESIRSSLGMFDELTRVNNDLSNLQRDLYRKNKELARSNEQKNRFLGMAAHDMRSPLGVILTYSEFLEEDAGPALNEEHREFIATIKEMSEFMLHLINDLLDVSQFESGKLRMEFRPVDLGEILRRNVMLNRVLGAKKQIRMTLDAVEGLPLLMLDRGKIEQVLNNLLSNAMKFSHENTEVSVRLAREPHYAVITIKDEGQGIPADNLAMLFKPFSRTCVQSTGGESSTGLGLSIVRSIVEGHGGAVEVESQVGKGSSFHVRLPLAQVRHETGES